MPVSHVAEEDEPMNIEEIKRIVLETPVAVVKDGQQVLVPQSSSYGLPPASSLEKPEKLQQVPATQVNAQNGNFVTIREIDAAIDAVKNNPEAGGLHT